MSLPTNTNIWTIFRNTHISLAKKLRTMIDLVNINISHGILPMGCAGQMLSYQIKISPVYVYSKWLSEGEEEEEKYYNDDANADDQNYILPMENPESFRSEHFSEDIKKKKVSASTRIILFLSLEIHEFFSLWNSVLFSLCGWFPGQGVHGSTCLTVKPLLSFLGIHSLFTWQWITCVNLCALWSGCIPQSLLKPRLYSRQ